MDGRHGDPKPERHGADPRTGNGDGGNDRLVVVTGIVTAMVVTGAVSYVTWPGAFTGRTPLGVAIYFSVAIAAPQYVQFRRRDSRRSLVLASVATLGAVAALLEGVRRGGVNGSWNVPVFLVLVVVVFGAILAAAARELRDGYRSGRR